MPCRKICILASLAFGRHVYPEQVHTEGITHITLGDVEYADAWGGVIKLIGSVKRTPEGKVQILVAPMMIPRESQLANVDDVFNGILVRGDETGDVVFYGKGGRQIAHRQCGGGRYYRLCQTCKSPQVPVLGRRLSRLCGRLPQKSNAHVCTGEDIRSRRTAGKKPMPCLMGYRGCRGSMHPMTNWPSTPKSCCPKV